MRIAKLSSVLVTALTAAIAVLFYKNGMWWQSAWAFTVMMAAGALTGALLSEGARMQEHTSHAIEHKRQRDQHRHRAHDYF